ncbi:MAG TPA: hypothetical protein PLM93_11835 [Sulfuricurvum sp.]|nr:MAG: hypothetical protein B7Y30_11050 [Campylobacterales bacterium 16-40-21]OZA02049.1 MAG: hypothetical protein B7X89_11035 [Sulfuricurvum sp. 17-40-25]HQS67866.1 hypothetical protein [Sulfuricurvum sp.]HQT37266.1 hypothetical protein [Sulfuricurvum sp.]
MTTIEIVYIVMGVSLAGFAFSLLYLIKEIKVLIVWSVALVAAQSAVYLFGYEIKWYVLAVLPFYFFSLAYILVKAKKMVNAAIKRIEEREKEEKQTLQATEDKSIKCKEAPYGK